MRRLAFSIATALCILAAAVIYLPHSTSAASLDKILTVTPATVKPVIYPGTAATGSFQVLNQGAQLYHVHIYSAPYSVQGEEYTPDFSPLPGRPTVTDWIRFNATSADIQPGQQFNVPYVISVPAGTQPGGYYVVAFAETQSNGANHGVVVNERVGEIFYIQVAGPVKQAGQLLTWSSPFLQRQPLSATLRLEDSGGIDYASNIHFVVQDVFGRAKYTFDTQKEILPQTIRKVPLSWNKTPLVGLFKVTGTVTVVGKTQTLPTRYVLVMAPVVRDAFLALIALVIIWLLSKRIRIPRRKSTKKHA